MADRIPFFPLEIWHQIFSYCDYHELKCVLPVVCRIFQSEIQRSSGFDHQLFRSKDIYPLTNLSEGTEDDEDGEDEGGVDPLDMNAPKPFKVHPALRGKVAITKFRKSLAFFGSKSKCERDSKPMPKDAWGKKRFKDLGDIYLSDCNIFHENATDPPVNKMLVILRSGDDVGGHGHEGFPPLARCQIDLTKKDGDQAVKVEHVLKCLVEYERHNTFNSDSEDTIETRIFGNGDKTTFKTTDTVMFGEEENIGDSEEGNSGKDYERSFSEDESNEEPDPGAEEEEAMLEEEGFYESSYRDLKEIPQRKYLREMDYLYATFERQIQNIQPAKVCLTLWGFMAD